MDQKQKDIRALTFRAILLYTLVGGCCVINILNYIETLKFNKELKKQCRLCKKMLIKKQKIQIEI